ncbi:hypothetical protein Geu3261_0163_004 [Komagataeibacter europaeus NBRC 3261]|uniref:Uncharacterized protein n=1 Tax=Komagataeibacter europaeus NBRC 3261 TaxID=1234669 RepID=A0A0D6Q195_KOMEU|nr:hypothetical protein [Komagataeibacter europaeus]GAN97337.1 hypothetical protein Geu3261_0163_004 [Komagataeibacter europaeus NBRC 3261]
MSDFDDPKTGKKRRPTILKNMKITEVSLCRAPASAGSDVHFFKSAEDDHTSATVLNRDELRALVAPIVAKTIAKAMPATQQKTSDEADTAQLDQLIDAHINSKRLPGETAEQAIVRLSHSDNDPVLSDLYSKRKLARALAARQRVKNATGVHANPVSKSAAEDINKDEDAYARYRATHQVDGE